MRWLKVAVETTPEAEEAVAELLRTAGAEGVVLEDGGADGRIVLGFLPASRQTGLDGLAGRVAGLAEFGLNPGSAQVETEWVQDDDWAEQWKRDYKPLALGRRLLVKPAWLPDPPGAADRVVIELDPGMAFGTGYHPTTALCLEALDEFVTPGSIVADIGTGSGILAIAAAKLGAARVVAVDTLAESVHVAEENCRLNGVEGIVRTAVGSTKAAGALLQDWSGEAGDDESVGIGAVGDASVGYVSAGGRATGDHGVGSNSASDAGADIVVVNILARVIRRLAPDLAALLKPGGAFIFSGIIEYAAEELVDHLRQHGLDVTEERRESEWVCLVGRRR